MDGEGFPSERDHHHHQARDKADAIQLSRANRFGYVPCVKERNGLFQYRFDANSGMLVPLAQAEAKLPDRIGTRHVAYHPTKPYVFFSNLQHLGASFFRIESAIGAGRFGGVEVIGRFGHLPHARREAPICGQYGILGKGHRIRSMSVAFRKTGLWSMSKSWPATGSPEG